MSNRGPRMLVIDDEEVTHKYISRMLGRYEVEVVSAFTNEEGLAKYGEHRGRFDAIGFDGHVDGSRMGTLELVGRISSDYSGPMVAFTSDPNLRLKMVTAGCNYECSKDQFVELVLQFIGIRTPS